MAIHPPPQPNCPPPPNRADREVFAPLRAAHAAPLRGEELAWHRLPLDVRETRDLGPAGRGGRPWRFGEPAKAGLPADGRKGRSVPEHGGSPFRVFRK